jgi:hypothetical protein
MRNSEMPKSRSSPLKIKTSQSDATANATFWVEVVVSCVSVNSLQLGYRVKLKKEKWLS